MLFDKIFIYTFLLNTTTYYKYSNKSKEFSMSKKTAPKLADICKKLVTTNYNGLEEEEKYALCNFLTLNADLCDDPGFYGNEDEFDDTGFKDVKIKQTSCRDDDAMANTIKFIFDGYTYKFKFLSATNWEEDLSMLIGWAYSVSPVKTDKPSLSEEDSNLLKSIIETVEKKEIDVKDIKDLMSVMELTPKNEIVKKFISWAVKNNLGFFFQYDTVEEVLIDFEKLLK